jgi:lysozyme family protein
MPDRFPACLAATLREEEGHDQPIGGPYIRGRWSYSDDPDDSGGKTMMGILQREYDPWRRNHGLPTQWVKNITDPELTDIYHDQFWTAMRADDLPAGVDLVTWDAAVNCGTGMSTRKLQTALGVKVDGHLGNATIDAARRADPVKLVEDFSALRERYHRGCRTFWKHGKNWLERTERIRQKSLAAVQKIPLAADPIHDVPDYHAEGYSETDTLMARADAPAPSPPVATEASLGLGGLGGLTAAAPGIVEKSAPAGKFSFTAFLLAVLSEPLFWVAATALFGAVMAYLWRRKHAH